MTIAVISHPDCLLHEMSPYHPEQPARLQAIDEALTHSGLDKIIKQYLAPPATREQLSRVHDEKYLDNLFRLSASEGLIYLDPDTAMNPFSLTAALRAAGAAVLAVDLVMAGELKKVFCNVRPPGHHAERSRAMGFCFFNNVAVGVAHALVHYSIKRIAIVDFDVHHGNGTEDIFRNEPRVLLCSSFQHPFYPFSGTESSMKELLSLPLPSGTSGKEYRKRVSVSWLERLRAFKPELIFFSAGFDAYADDEMANLLLREDDYAWLTQEIKKIADDFCQGRMISVLEGGYDLKGLGRCVAAHLQAMI